MHRHAEFRRCEDSVAAVGTLLGCGHPDLPEQESKEHIWRELRQLQQYFVPAAEGCAYLAAKF